VPKSVQTVLPSVTGDGEARLLRPLVRLPVATCFCQSTFPVCRSMHSSNKFPSASGLLMNTASSQMMGVAELGPGRAADQRTLSVLLKVSGRLVSVVEPLRKGPRHCGQFSAEQGTATSPTKQPVASEMAFIK
jgi:hypothetical protein